jgi:hydrogenase nickel incorporation protein HypA/HybF
MHEASLMKGLMRRIGEVAAAEGGARVTGIAVRLGALSHMSPEHFTEHFVAASKGTIAENAELEITLAEDPEDAAAQDIVLESVEIET